MKLALVTVVSWVAAAGVVASCGGSTTSDDGGTGMRDGTLDKMDGGHESGGQGPAFEASCNGIAIIPPLFTVKTSAGVPICDPTVAVVDEPDAFGGPSSPGFDKCPGFGGCPYVAADAGSEPCQFVLGGLSYGTFTVQVAAPGFAPVLVSNVFNGEGGCVPTTPASQETVTLSPLPDGSTSSSSGGGSGSSSHSSSASSAQCGIVFFPPDFPSSCQTALDQACCSEEQACGASAGCVDLVDCINACPPPRQGSCVSACGATDAGVADLDAIATCTKTEPATDASAACDWP